MTDLMTLEEAFAVGKAAGMISAAQALECPYPHHQSFERRAWMDGFSAGRVSIAVSSVGASEGNIGSPATRRPMPFGSRVVYHHSTCTIAVEFQGEMTVLGPFRDVDAAYQAAFGFVEMKRAWSND